MTDDELLLVQDYPNLEILRFEHDRVHVFYKCCGRQSKAKKTTIKKHIKLGLTKCKECAKGNVLPASPQVYCQEHSGQPRAFLKNFRPPNKYGPHWWATLSN